MGPMSSDQVGELGERIVMVTLTRPVKKSYRRPLFRVVSLGSKYPAADCIVDLVDSNEFCRGFFYVQIKSTNRIGSTTRLPVKFEKNKFCLLSKLPIPTYLIGVDVSQEHAFIVTVNKRMKTAPASIPKLFDLSDDSIKIAIYKEVSTFWQSNKLKNWKSQFMDPIV